MTVMTTTPDYVECVTATGGSTVETSTKPDWLEMDVVAGFRVWQLMFLALGGLMTLIILLCCCMKCRIPRTKQEIEADFVRKKLTRRFRTHLNKLPMEDINFKGALEKVKQLCGDDESPKKSEKLMSRDNSQEKKLTFMQRLRKFLEPVDQNRGREDEEDEEEKKDPDEESRSEEDDPGSGDQVKLELDPEPRTK